MAFGYVLPGAPSRASSPVDRMPMQRLAEIEDSERAPDQAAGGLRTTIVSWLTTHNAAPDNSSADRIATVAASFAVFCSPKTASFHELSLGAKFIAMFFLVDDAIDADVVRHRYHVETLLESGRDSETCSSLERLLADIIKELGSFGVATRAFVESWRCTCVAVEQERQLEGCMISAEQLFEVRQQTIAVHPYIYLWYVMRGIDLSPHEHAITTRLRYLVAEEVILCNDLASVEKDQREGSNEPNYLLFLQRTPGVRSIASAATLLVQRYNRQLREIDAERDTCLAVQPGARMEQIIQLALMLVDGNVKASRRMVSHRYSDDGLHRLLLLNPGETAPWA